MKHIIIKSNRDWYHNDINVLNKFWDVIRYKFKLVHIGSALTLRGKDSKFTVTVEYPHFEKDKYERRN